MADVRDIELLRRWRDGDDAAGCQIVQRYSETLRRFFANKAPDLVADMSQQTFMAALEAVDRITPGRSFRSYLFGIANNILLMHARKRIRGERAIARTAVTSEGLYPSPSLVAAGREDVRLLLDTLRRVPLERQVILELHYWEELSLGEIADVLGVELGTVKSRLSRARAQLREEMRRVSPGLGPRGDTAERLERWAHQLRHATC